MSQPVGLLTTRDHPLLPYFLDHLGALPGVAPVLIFDDKGFGDRNREIFAARTENAFPARSLAPFLDRYRWANVPDHNGKTCREFVGEQKIGLLVNAGTPRLVKPALLEAASIGVLNVHPGILPKYRGASCPEWALHHGDPVGVTAHFMDDGLDSGPILFTRELAITPGQRYTQVRVALYYLAHAVRAEAIAMIFAQNLTPDQLPPQPNAPVFQPIPDELLEAVKAKLGS